MRFLNFFIKGKHVLCDFPFAFLGDEISPKWGLLFKTVTKVDLKLSPGSSQHGSRPAVGRNLSNRGSIAHILLLSYIVLISLKIMFFL